VSRKRFYIDGKIEGKWVRVATHYFADSAITNAKLNYVEVRLPSGPRVFSGVRVIHGKRTLIRWKNGDRT
jgi:hypothetical protein